MADTNDARLPVVIQLEDGELFAHEDGGRNIRLITRGEHGPAILFGASWLEPGQTTREWSTELEGPTVRDVLPHAHVDEVYFVVAGRIEVIWDGDGTCVCGPFEAVYLPPGHRYKVCNVGRIPAFLILGQYPAIA